MTAVSSTSSRIAKNTVFLYIRMLFTLAVKLYTSRVVLAALGVEDYGVYTVVAGIVTMFSFFTTSLSSAISRYLTYSLGKGDLVEQIKVFSTSVTILAFVGVLVIGLVEIIAPWFLATQMNIPEGRLFAAQWCLQCTIITFIINLLCVPFNATIIAHEKMSVYAYISILEVSLLLGAALSMECYDGDKLIYYGIAMTSVALLIQMIYGFYCKIRFRECKYKLVLDKKLTKEIFGFTSWSLLGNGAYVMNNQGINIVMNIFFGVTINAARGVADQIHAAMMQFLSSFTVALNPQIVKSYAVGDINYVNQLVCKGAKYSFYLSLLMAIPLLLETENILCLWLKNYPQHAPLFVRLTILGTIIDFMGNTTARAVWATGNVRKYYLVTSILSLMVLPITYLMYLMGMNPETSYFVYIVIYLVLIPTRLVILKGLMEFSPVYFFKTVIKPIIPVTIISVILPFLIHFVMNLSFLRLICVCLTTLVSLGFTVYAIGITFSERLVVKRKLYSLVNKYLKRKNNIA